MLLLFALSASTACRASTPTPVAPTQPAPTPVPTAEPTRARPTAPEEITFLTVAVDVPDRTGQFARFDAFGNVEGFDADLLAALAEAAGVTYEVIVTPFWGETPEQGILPGLIAGRFDAAVSAIELPDAPQPGIAYTEPYLEIGQVLVVRANETAIAHYRDVTPDMRVAVVAGTVSARAAREVLELPESQIVETPSAPAALQAVSDFAVRAAIVDSYDAEAYTDRYYQRLKMVGSDRSDWIAQKRYVAAVSADNPALLALLNQAIAQVRSGALITQLADKWLVPDEAIAAGESLIGTPADRLIIGVVGSEGNLSPADRAYAPINWEIKANTLSGLLMYDADNQLVPALAAALPEIGNGGLHYDFTLRDGLTFPDGSSLTAEVVKNALTRSVLSGNWFVNAFLKNTDGDGFADDDAIQVLDRLRIRFVLREPTAYFVSLLATPPYYITGPACDPANFDPVRACAGIAPYTVTDWEPGVTLRLEANPNWPLTPPIMNKVELRFYPTSQALRDSLSNEAIDIAWHGLGAGDRDVLLAQPIYQLWRGPGLFKSYLVFEHAKEPWNDPRVRQAAAYAADREALARDVFRGQRTPLFSPLPDGVPGQIAAEPTRDLARAAALLREAGYSEARPAEVELWFINDGRYTNLEDRYAEAIKAQLEETGLFRVTVNGAPWPVFRAEMSACNYPAFLLGWPPQGEPRYLEAMTWISYFVSSTENICSNYASPAMDALIAAVRATTDPAERLEQYRAIQALWADEYPTLDLTQEVAAAVSLAKVTNAQIDALGVLHYETLAKNP